jgi:hypothetical protein
MQAALIAAVAEIDLQRIERGAAQRREIGGLKQGQRGMHGFERRTTTNLNRSRPDFAPKLFTDSSRWSERFAAVNPGCGLPQPSMGFVWN